MMDSVMTDDFRAWVNTKPKSLRSALVRAEDVHEQYMKWCKGNGTYQVGLVALGRCMRKVFPHARSMQITEGGVRVRHYHNGERKPFVEAASHADDLLDI